MPTFKLSHFVVTTYTLIQSHEIIIPTIGLTDFVVSKIRNPTVKPILSVNGNPTFRPVNQKRKKMGPFGQMSYQYLPWSI